MSYNDQNPIKLLVADDHEVVRIGLRRLLSNDKSLQIMDEAPNGNILIELAEYHKPDVILSDIMMPEMDGIRSTEIIKSRFPEIFILMLTAYEDSFHLDRALNAGADGYLSKDIGAKELIEAIHSITKGERVFSKSIIRLMQKKSISEVDMDASPVSITKREQEILNLIAMGKTSAEVADTLFLSVRTVESHRYNLMQKLGLKNAAGLIRYAVTSKS